LSNTTIPNAIMASPLAYESVKWMLQNNAKKEHQKIFYDVFC
jgi:hypothetical protein